MFGRHVRVCHGVKVSFWKDFIGAIRLCFAKRSCLCVKPLSLHTTYKATNAKLLNSITILIYFFSGGFGERGGREVLCTGAKRLCFAKRSSLCVNPRLVDSGRGVMPVLPPFGCEK